MRFIYFIVPILIYIVYTLALLRRLLYFASSSLVHRMYITSKSSNRPDLRFLVAVIHRRLTTQAQRYTNRYSQSYAITYTRYTTSLHIRYIPLRYTYNATLQRHTAAHTHDTIYFVLIHRLTYNDAHTLTLYTYTVTTYHRYTPHLHRHTLAHTYNAIESQTDIHRKEPTPYRYPTACPSRIHPSYSHAYYVPVDTWRLLCTDTLHR